MSDQQNLDYAVDGAGIFSRGRQAGFSGVTPITASPYPVDHWTGEIWQEAYRAGEQDRLSLGEPSLPSTMQDFS
ncbi:hypothetical protein [Marinobacter gelidimuriae]|jgi:hypothetical protein|uniref:hypothetical protein n=1 Tax=Marinobacter gelidimuriae TaxID=2739064 RepID=UPI000363B717|nr:hypothetical protein [Marinobacter gelidimuriae]